MKTKSPSQLARKLSKSAIVLMITALALSMPAAFAGTTSWTLRGTGNWFTGTNWDDGEPDFTTDAQINNGGTAQISVDFPMAEALSLTLGLNVGDSGTVEVSSAHGDLSVGQAVFVGYRGTGNLTSTFGTITSATASIASLSGELWVSNGAATIDGSRTSWIISGRCDVGGYNGNPGGVALLNITNGATVTAGDLVRVYSSGTLKGGGTVSTTNGTTIDGTLAPSGTLSIGGDLIFSNPTATMQSNVTPATADNVSASGEATLDGRLSVTMTGTFTCSTTRYILLYAGGGRNPTHPQFASVSITYPTNQGFTPQITYDGDYVYVDLVFNNGCH